jgi:hypothetical protein
VGVARIEAAVGAREFAEQDINEGLRSDRKSTNPNASESFEIDIVHNKLGARKYRAITKFDPPREYCMLFNKVVPVCCIQRVVNPSNSPPSGDLNGLQRSSTPKASIPRLIKGGNARPHT